MFITRRNILENTASVATLTTTKVISSSTISKVSSELSLTEN